MTSNKNEILQKWPDFEAETVPMRIMETTSFIHVVNVS